MLNGRKFAGKRLPLTVAFAVLLVAAFGAGCKGFFQPNALESIAIQPPTPEVEVGESTSLQAWGTYEDNTRSQIMSGVAWTSSDPTTIAVDPNTGLMTAPSTSTGGTATITAAAQGLSATATATSYLGTIANFEICEGTFNTGTCPAPTWSVSASSGGSQDFYAKATSNSLPIDVTTVSTWTITPTPTSGTFTCVSSSSPAVCTPTGVSTGSYLLTVTYTTGSPSATLNINVTP